MLKVGTRVRIDQAKHAAWELACGITWNVKRKYAKAYFVVFEELVHGKYVQLSPVGGGKSLLVLPEFVIPVEG